MLDTSCIMTSHHNKSILKVQAGVVATPKVQLTAYKAIYGTQTHIYVVDHVDILYFFVPGVVVFDKQQGFWLVHSTPHFPPPKSAGMFSYPSSGVNNGQNFICVTYPFDRFQTIGTSPMLFSYIFNIFSL